MVDVEPVTPAQVQPVVVTLPAEIDMANADAVGAQIDAAFGPGVQVVIADMTATTFIDTSGTRMLVLAWKRATTNGTELQILLPNPNLLHVMHILGLDTVLPIYQNLEDLLTGGPLQTGP
jgi:anti-sigma B factor antagonist